MIAMGQMRLTPVKGKAAGEGSISGDGTLVGGYWANALEAVTTRAPTAHPSSNMAMGSNSGIGGSIRWS